MGISGSGNNLKGSRVARTKVAIISMLATSVLFGSGGCFSMLQDIGGKGGPSTSDKIAAATMDFVTMPIQLPFWLAIGIAATLDGISNVAADSEWELKRNRQHTRFRENPEAMQSLEGPALDSKGLVNGKVYVDAAIPLKESFLVSQVMHYFSFVRGGMICFAKQEELAALMLRKEWTENGLRAVAAQFYLGRRQYPAPDYFTLAYLSNPKTPVDIIEFFRESPSFKYRKQLHYCKTMRNEITTNILSRIDRAKPECGDVIKEDPGLPEYNFLQFLRNVLGHRFEPEATWSVGGGMWNLCAVGVPVAPSKLRIGDTTAKLVELYGNKKFNGWDEKSRYDGPVGAVVLEFESMAERDRFLRAILPVCQMTGPECWDQLLFAPMDSSREMYGICLEREGKKDGESSRIFVIELGCSMDIRFWPSENYHRRHLWFADEAIP